MEESLKLWDRVWINGQYREYELTIVAFTEDGRAILESDSGLVFYEEPEWQLMLISHLEQRL